MALQSIYEFQSTDRSTSGRAAGAISNNRLRIPALKALSEIDQTSYISNSNIGKFLKGKIALTEADLRQVGKETEFDYRIKWALNSLKNGDLIDKNPNAKLSWKITELGIEYLKKYDLFENELIDVNLIKEVNNAYRDQGKKYAAPRYWALGFGSGQRNWYERLEDFKKNNYWQALDYSNDDTKKAAENARALFTEMQVGDFALIKGFGGKSDLKVHYVGKIVSIDPDLNKISFEPVPVNLYNGKAPKGEGAGNWFSTILEVARKRDIDSLFHGKIITDQINEPVEVSDSENYSGPLNQILYGPPGTGKTYNTVLEAAKIVSGRSDLTFDEALDIFNANLKEQIEFVTFHQNFSYEDFIQGLRPETENGSALTFEKKDGVFKRIADKALKNLEASKNPASAKKEFDLVFHELIQPLNDGDVNEVEVKMKKSSFFITEVGEKSIAFRKSIGDSEHTLSINTLRKMYEKGVNDIILGGLQPYYNPILELLLQKGKSISTAVPRKNFVIIIDEINRANISRVFGELITLIEEDKRSQGAIPMSVTLPSGDDFKVPSNLYIIGTMNTADKSIALLDIALRRRFEFVPMYPKYKIEGQTIYHHNALEIINQRICKLKTRDFQIGHAYFMEHDNLEHIMNSKVIPLLLEYFMNNEEEVKKIIDIDGYNLEPNTWPMNFRKN